MHMHWDEDAYERVYHYTACPCGQTPGACSHPGRCMASASFGYRPRPPADVARIKAERQAREEEEILAKADAIRARRAMAGGVSVTLAQPTADQEEHFARTVASCVQAGDPRLAQVVGGTAGQGA